MNTIQLIENYYRFFNAKNWPQFISLLDPQVQHDISSEGTEIGRDKFSSFMERMNEHYQETISDLAIFTTSDPKRAAAEFIVTGRYIKTDIGLPVATGQTYKLPVGAFFEVNETHITRVTLYYNLPAWLRQVQQ